MGGGGGGGGFFAPSLGPPRTQTGGGKKKRFVQETDYFLNKGKVKPKEVLLSLPRQNYTLQSFNVPPANAQALDSMIQLEMDRHFAFPLESMCVSYHVVPGASNQNHVIAAATKREKN